MFTKIRKHLTKINKAKINFLYHHFKKYVVDYKVEEDHIRVFSNIGRSKVVKNTKENQTKLNQIIIKHKIAIANKIDEYEKNSKERLIVILLNMFLVGTSGMLVPFTFFIGNYILFVLAIVLFSFSTIAISMITLDYYIQIKEINYLKNITGYKKDLEFKLPSLTNNMKMR